MINPYEILEVDQDAPMQEIIKSMQKAMITKKHPIPVLTEARKQLSSPDKRLASDFTFLVIQDAGKLHPFPTTDVDGADISKFKIDKYDSL